ncbi:MAG: hypothetical protein U1G07_26600 [Verrucomicrobiota bacterium]
MILVNLKRALCVCLFIGSILTRGQDDDMTPEPAELTGVVLDEVGEPVVGAHVFVESARPRHGTATGCPSCYPDCGKRAQTNAKGDFNLGKVESGLLYRLVLVAKGYEAAAMDKVDPVLSPVSCSLWKRSPPEEGQRLINARVYDAAGQPAAGALVDVAGAEAINTTTWGGHKRYVQELGVTDQDGVLTMVGTSDLKAALGILRCRGYAEQWIRLVPGQDQLFVLREGVLVSGQALKDGKPVPGLQVGFAGADRSAGEFLRGWNVTTDNDGRFSFPHVTASKGFVVYSTSKSAAKVGLLATRGLTTGPDGTKLDLGKIEVQLPLHIRGRVVTEDGEAPFPGSRIGLGREQAWDSQEANLDDEGRFEFDGLGREIVEMYFRGSEYKFSKKNPNRVSGRSIAGRLNDNLEDFTIVLEAADPGNDRNFDEEQNWNVRETPLRGPKK